MTDRELGELSRALASRGLAIVWRRATDAMKSAGAEMTVMHSWSSMGEHIDEESASDVWAAMLAAGELK